MSEHLQRFCAIGGRVADAAIQVRDLLKFYIVSPTGQGELQQNFKTESCQTLFGLPKHSVYGIHN